MFANLKRSISLEKKPSWHVTADTFSVRQGIFCTWLSHDDKDETTYHVLGWVLCPKHQDVIRSKNLFLWGFAKVWS